MLIWFTVLSLLGLWGIAQQPHILLALNPLYGIRVVVNAPRQGFFMLGAVFLAVTGTEALYADMGHFGREALRRALPALRFPALPLNYFPPRPPLLAPPPPTHHPSSPP